MSNFVLTEWEFAEGDHWPSVGVSVWEDRLSGHHQEAGEGHCPAAGSAGQGPPLPQEGLQLRQHRQGQEGVQVGRGGGEMDSPADVHQQHCSACSWFVAIYHHFV